jgi:hypothetical protein
MYEFESIPFHLTAQPRQDIDDSFVIVMHAHMHTQVLVNAICPERALGGNEISALASVTDVYVSNDLQVSWFFVVTSTGHV